MPIGRWGGSEDVHPVETAVVRVLTGSKRHLKLRRVWRRTTYKDVGSVRGFPSGTVVKESACQCRRHGFDPWVRKIPWRRKWQSTSVFLPGKFPGRRSLGGHSPWGSQKSQTRLSAHGQYEGKLPRGEESQEKQASSLLDLKAQVLKWLEYSHLVRAAAFVRRNRQLPASSSKQ